MRIYCPGLFRREIKGERKRERKELPLLIDPASPLKFFLSLFSFSRLQFRKCEKKNYSFFFFSFSSFSIHSFFEMSEQRERDRESLNEIDLAKG